LNSASTATLVRLRYLLAYNTSENYLLSIANIAVWSITESGIGLIAGSMATLRPLLKYIPFLKDTFSSGAATTGMSRSRKTKGDRSTNHAHSHPLDTLPLHTSNAHHTTCDADSSGWERLSDSDSQRNILKEGTITVTKDIKQDYSDAISHNR
jgi:hypothetical protein